MTDETTLDDLPQPEYEGTVAVDELEVDGDNPNEMTDEQFGLLCDRMRDNGWLGGPVITDTNGLIADGEHRWRAAQEIGLSEVPVRQYDITDAKRRLWRQELNKIHGEHDTKRDALEYDQLLSEGYTEEVEALTDAADEDLDELLEEIRVETSRPAEYEYDPEHNVYFEDCVEGMRERLDDNSVDCVIADPPYGIDYRGREGGDGEREDVFDKLANMDPSGMIDGVLSELERVLREDGHIYLFTGWQQYGFFEDVFRTYFSHHNTLVWDKQSVGLSGGSVVNGTIGPARYRPQHEFCLFGVLSAPRILSDTRKLSDVLSHERDTASEYSHPTQKPVPLITDLLTNSTHEGDTVLDPFMGSGTTAVAAIQNDRDYVGFEIDEQNYRDVIERRISEAKRAKAASVNQDQDESATGD